MTQIQPITSSHSTIINNNNNTIAVQVALRVRPLTQVDRAQPRFSHSTNSDVIKVFENSIAIVPHQKSFQFDHVFDASSTQEQVFTSVASNFVDRFIDGYNVTILAYGQTSSGKTYTMGTAINNGFNSEQEGIIPRAMSAFFARLEDIRKEQSPATKKAPTTTTVLNTFPPTSGLRVPKKSISSTVKLRSVSMIAPLNTSNTIPLPRRGSNATTIPNNNTNDKSTRYTVHVSFIEIYNEELIDLLNPAPPNERTPVTIREDTKGHIIWTGLKEVPVNNTQDVLRYLQMGTENRATGSTDMNAKSSRSHAIFSVTLKQEKWVPSASTSTTVKPSDPPVPTATKSLARKSTLNVKALIGQMEKQSRHDEVVEEEGDWMIVNSKFHFVDLAGSERLKRTAAQGDRRKEGININAGLLALGNVISALSDPSKKATHVPYRDSKLTRLLQDSLGGNSTTLMIACVSPAESNLTETINTIKYANRARHIRNKSERNEQEEWMTTDNLDQLRHMIQKLKNEIKSLKGIHHRGTPSPMSSSGQGSPTKSTHQMFGIVSPSNSSLSDDHPSTSMSATTNLTVPEPTSSIDLFDSATTNNNEIAVMVADLHRQIEELQNEVTVTRERNQLVEDKLRQASSTESTPFQHLVEPVIEEYEKSIAGLESQLALARATLSHSDQTLQEQQAKLDHYQSMQETEVQSLEELKQKLATALERERTSESYCLELEAQLEAAVREGHKDQQVLSELREKIIKFRDMDEHTEQYISDLESRLSEAELQRIALTEKITALSVREPSTEVALQDQTTQTTVSSTQDISLQTDIIAKQDELIQTDVVSTQDMSLQTDFTMQQQDQLAAEKEGLQRELIQCQTKRQEFEQELARIKEELATKPLTSDQHTQSEKYVDEESVAYIASLLSEKESYLTAIDTHVTDLEHLKSQLFEERVRHSEEIDRLENSVASLKERCTSHNQQLAQEQLHHQETIDKYQAELKTLHLVEEKQDAVIQGLENKLEEIDHLVTSLHTQLDERNETIQALETENKTKSDIAASMQKQLEGILKDVCGMGMEKKQLQQVMYFMEGTLRLQEAKSEKTMESLEDIKHIQKVREEEIEEKRRTVNLLAAEKQELTLSLEQVFQRASHGDEMVEKLEVELNQARLSLTEHEQLVQELKQKQAQSSFELQRVAALEARVQQLDAEMVLQQEAKIEKENELNQLEQAVQKQLTQNELLIKTIAELELTIKEERALVANNDSTGLITELENKLNALQQAKKREDNVWKAQMEKTREELFLSYKETQEYKLKVESLQVSLLKQDNPQQKDLLDRILQLEEDNAQLLKHNDNLESQLIIQRGQLTLETKNLELELMKLTAANDRLEKEMEQVIPRSNNAAQNHRDSMQFTSPPQTPRVSSPPPPTASNSTGMMHYKLQRDLSTSSIAKLSKSGSFRSVSTMLQQSQQQQQDALDDDALKRLSFISLKDANLRPSSSLRSSRTIVNSAGLPPPTAPPSNPLPPIPTPLPPLPNSPTPPSINGSLHDSEPGSPSVHPIRESSLQRQDSTASTSFSEIMNATSSSNFTAEQYDKLIRSLQRKAQFAENDVRAHQEVITKLESQLSRSESSVREVKKQLDLLSREKQAYNLEIQNLRTQVTQIQSQQKNMTDEQIQERKELEEQLEQQKMLKEKAEKARRILENRMDELMNKKSKFMCF